MMNKYLIILLMLAVSGCDRPSPDTTKTSNVEPEDMSASAEFVAVLPKELDSLHNPEAVIPPQCYTKTEKKYNPCYTCHQSHPYGTRPNVMQDQGLQGDYDFSEVGVNNQWHNLFVDRRAAIAFVSDQDIIDYVDRDNYSKLSTRLENQGWQGYLPDLNNLHLAQAAFEADGFAKDDSGWVAFNYKPLASTFWPTNGATDDVFIRLPEAFRSDSQGRYNKSVYQANLAILEANIKAEDVAHVIDMDEATVGFDLNNDGVLNIASHIDMPDHYVGAASAINTVEMLYPEGTEFLHTVRYVGVNEQGDIYVPKRMKELRYMRKIAFFSAPKIASIYGNEHQEKIDGNLPKYPRAGDWGLDNKMGWQISGFIENSQGELRVQNYEENFFCMGCHTTIGATIDHTFAFPRKVSGPAGWGYINLKGMKDAPVMGEQEGEILTYLKRVCGGDEFRQNDEMKAKFFLSECEVNEEAVAAADVYALISPSRERALALNKAYRLIVEEQSFEKGRDASIAPAINVFKSIDQHAEPLQESHRHSSDIRLDWALE